jgi:uncharacterized MAPEG superfamily protein
MAQLQVLQSGFATVEGGRSSSLKRPRGTTDDTTACAEVRASAACPVASEVSANFASSAQVASATDEAAANKLLWAGHHPGLLQQHV